MSYKALLQNTINKTLSVENPYIKTLQVSASQYSLTNVSAAESYWDSDTLTLVQGIKGFLNTEIKENRIVTTFAPYQAEFLTANISLTSPINVNDEFWVNNKKYQIVGLSDTVDSLTKLFLREI